MLDKDEIKRQSILFEVFKSEKDYVNDLELVKEVCLDSRFFKIVVPTSEPSQVFIGGLLGADPPVVSPDYLESFISEVFGNINPISSHHHRMLAALFSRQREQHPLVQSVTDIILDSQSDVPNFFPCAALRFTNQLPFSSALITKLTSKVTLSPKVDIGLSSRRTQSTTNGYNSVTEILEYGSETWSLSSRDPSQDFHGYPCCSRQSSKSQTRSTLTTNRYHCSSAY